MTDIGRVTQVWDIVEPVNDEAQVQQLVAADAVVAPPAERVIAE